MFLARLRPSPLVHLLAAVGPVLLGCATTREPESIPPVPDSPTPIATPSLAPPAAVETKPVVCNAFIRPGVLRRRAVNETVDAGVGRWLAGGAEVKQKLAKAKFQGWEVVRLYPGDPCYRQIDLRPGDVVTQVNGKSIERPEQAFAVFSSLRTDTTLVVDYLRAGQPKRLSLDIANE